MYSMIFREDAKTQLVRWEVLCPEGHHVGYAHDPVDVLLALAADGENAVTLRSPSGAVSLALLDAPALTQR